MKADSTLMTNYEEAEGCVWNHERLEEEITSIHTVQYHTKCTSMSLSAPCVHLL